MEIQNIITQILKKHNIDASKDFYIKLIMPPHQDLIIERNADVVTVGHYIEQKGDLIGNPVFAMYVSGKQWYPMRFDQIFGSIICAWYKKGKHYIHPDRVKGFLAFQRMFAKNIREQGWLENGIPIKEAIVNDVFLIGKDDPNPFIGGKSKTDYANPNEEEK